MALLDLVYRYRTLLGKCELTIGLSFDEIEELCGLEAIFAPDVSDERRRFRRSPVAMAGFLRNDELNDSVKVSQLGAGGCEVRGAPYIEEGSRVELCFDVGHSSYRFGARAVTLREDGNDFRVGFAFEGVPLLVQGGQSAVRSPGQSANRLVASIYQQLSAVA